MAALQPVVVKSSQTPVLPASTELLALVKFMFFSERLLVLVNSAPRVLIFWMVPPEPSVEPVPVTVRPPLAPVVLSTIPFVAPLAEMLRNVSPDAPILVLVTVNAVPVVDVNVLAVSVEVTVPPPVALKAVFVPDEIVSVPVKLIVEPVLLVRSMPLPVVEVIVPL